MRIKLLFTVVSLVCSLPFVHSQCSYLIYDTGGANANYSNNETYEATHCPSVPGTQITVTFTEFNVEAGMDGLYIHDGNSSAAPIISSPNGPGSVPGGVPGAYWGTTIPGPFVSSSPDGCLTFRFRSNGTGTAPGWRANVSCTSSADCTLAPTSLAATNVTSNSVALGWTESGTAFSWEIAVKTCGTPPPTEDMQGTMASVNPFVITGFSPNTCHEFYVRSWCGTNDYSPWSGPLTVTTNISSPVCGGAYYDTNGPSENYANNENVITTICPFNAGEVVTVHFNSFSTEAQYDALYVYNGSTVSAPQISSGNTGGNVPGGLPGGFWGTEIPESFTSSSVEGCLTFRFVSNESNNAPGWDADVTCALSIIDSISLQAFVDGNGNSIKDSNELVFPYGTYVYQINNTGEIYSGNSDNSYSIITGNVTNTYDLSFQVTPEYATYYESNVTFNDITIAQGSGVNNFYFPIENIAPYDDVAVHLYPLTNPQPGFNYTNMVVFQNFGTTPVDGTISFTKDPLLSITNVTPGGIVTTGNGFTYAYTNLQPLETRALIVTMGVPTIPTVSLGTLLTNSVTITGAGTDVISYNNTASWTSTVVGSYDPNDIMESHGPQIVFSEFDNSDYLYYTIRFQNTGTANATTVRVENLLDSQLDPNSISLITASHDYSMTRSGNQLTWIFDDIQLVPESVNSDASNGYVVYKIKPDPGYAIGDIIPSIAEIYFDFNPAIITETFNTEFVEQLAIGGFDAGKIRLYPNPANNNVFLSVDGQRSISTITINDLLGKVVLKQTSLSGNQAQIDVTELSQGIYTVTINTSDNLRTVRKLIIQ